MIHLAISNIAWPQKYDRKMYCEMATLGYTGLEIAPGRIMGEEPYRDTDAAARWAEALWREFRLSVPSMQSIWYGRQENIFRSRTERETLMQYSVAAVSFAEAISCRNLVFGCPRNRNIEQPAANTYPDALEFFEKLGLEAKAHGVILGVEANPTIYHTNFLNTTEEATELVRQCGSGGLGLNLDLGTMLCNGESLEKIREWVPLISHIHISEPGLGPIRKRPEHRRLFEILREEHYAHFVSVEMGCCGEIETVIGVMKYIMEVYRSALH